MSHQSDNIPAGTQVAQIEVRGTKNSLVHPRGAVGIVTRTPAVACEKFITVSRMNLRRRSNAPNSMGRHPVGRSTRIPSRFVVCIVSGCFCRQSFHEYAKESILQSRWAAAHYRQQRQKSCGHHTAVRSPAFTWQRIILRLWQSQTLCHEEVYEASLKKRNSPLMALLDKIEVGKFPVKTMAKKV